MADLPVIPEPRHYPTPLKRFGVTPFGRNLYRLVYSDSVMFLSGRTWPDGATEYRLTREYRHFAGKWILQRWLPASRYTGMSKEMYDIMKKDPKTGLFLTGPYPIMGEYQMVGDHPIDPTQVEDRIRRAEYFYQRPNPNGVMVAAHDQALSAEAARDELMLQEIKECRPAFGQRPTSFHGHVHSVKSRPSINVTPLPARSGPLVLGR